MSDDLIDSLRALAVAHDSYLSIAAYDAVDRIERLRAERDEARAEVEKLQTALDAVTRERDEARAYIEARRREAKP